MKGKAVLPFSLLVAFTLLAAIPGAAEPLATLDADASGLHFSLQGSIHERYVLTVSGPDGQSIRQAFGAATAPFLAFADPAGTPLPDGLYHYELRAQPHYDEAFRAALAAARAADDDQAAARLRAAQPMPDPADLVQNGTFVLDNGRVYLPSGAAEPEAGDKASVGKELPLKDQVILDDLIVDGSTCIGTDCVNNESFGSDTLRLKETTLRIKFQDTSTAAGYPTTDWQLTANDSPSGGANKFSIDNISAGRTPFTLSAGARNNALFVASSGNVGFGTTVPADTLHAVAGNTPALRLEQDTSGAFAAETWAVAGNETNFYVSNETGTVRYPLRIRPDAPTNSLYVHDDGSFGLGTSNPDQKLHVFGGGAKVESSATLTSFILESTASPGSAWILRANGTNGAFTFTSGGISPVRVTTAGLEVTGSLLLNGTPVTPDYVFEPDFPLETIEEHASYMWENKHLPALTPAAYSDAGQGRLDLGALQLGMLEELEKAHVYIEQLHGSLQDLRSANEAKDEKIADLETRLARLESLNH